MEQKFRDSSGLFFEERYGMFIHWGLYAIPAWHEQILWRGKMRRKDYEPLMHQFNPSEYDPDAWLDVLEEAGMQYICFTTKHHDGFCMWDTGFSDYNIMNTPYGKDVLGMLAEACRRRAIPLGLYYSCPDWHHPHYPNCGRHHEMFGPRAGDEPDIEKYYDYVKNQVGELCSNYGELHQFFWDVNVAEYYDPGLNEMIRSLQPKALINDRGPGAGDYSTPERHVPEGKEFKRPTQAVQSLGRESWGYKEDEDYYSHKSIIQSMDKVLAMGGNYMLNVGPKADGTMMQGCIDALVKIGKWHRSVKEAFDGTYPASTMVVEDHIMMGSQKIERDNVLLTRKANTIYIHLYKDPQSSALILKPLDIMPERVVLLNTGGELEARVDVTPWHWREKPYLRIRNIPVNEQADTVMVIKLEFNGAVAE